MGVICGVTVISNVFVVAHCPTLGVNVYVTVPLADVFIVDGLHVPGIGVAFVELPGNTGAAEFWQSGPIALKVGVICGVIVISNVFVVAHCPTLGVNVYVTVPLAVVLIVDGLHVPGIGVAFVELPGNNRATEF